MTAMDAGISGMLAEQTRMDAVGNNIANANTPGFKSSDVLFADALYQVISTNASGGTTTTVGQGVMVAGSDTNFGQGTLTATGRTTDVAINGDGFLTVTDGTNLYYTRSGSLGLDSAGNLVQLVTGMRVVGLPAAPASATPGPPPAVNVTPTSTLKIPLGQTSTAQATSQMALGGNLDSRVAAGANYQVTATVYDSLGASHPITLTFSRSATAGQWTVAGSSADGTVTVSAPAQVAFDASGAPTVKSLPVQMTLTNAGGATAALNINLDLTNVTQLAQDGSAATRSQDGRPPGTLTGISINSDGSVMGVFTNGLKSPLGQLVTSVFSNPHGLQNAGNSLYQVGADSGVPAYGAPGSNGRGALRNGELEQSNVDLAKEFSDMIITQRAYQANSRLVTATDQMLQTLITLGQ